MNSRARIALAIAAIALLSGALWWARSAERVPKDRVEVAGKVRSELWTVAAPAIVYPTPDYTVGIPKPASASAMGGSSSAGGSGGGAGGGTGGGSSAGGGTSAKSAAARPGSSQIAGRITTVTVRLGDAVAEGQVLARFDTAMLDLGVTSAQAAAAKSRADVGLMSDNLDTIASNQSKLSSAQGKLATGREKLLSTRKQLRSTRANLVAARAKAVAGRSAIGGQIAQLESIPTTLTPQQKAILAGLRTNLAKLNAGITKMDAGITKITAGLVKIEAALAKLPSAEKQLSTAKGALSDAKTQVTNARDTLRILVDARDVAIALAKQRRDKAVVTAPVAGVVTYVRPAGTSVMVGAPLVRIRPDATQLVDTYLTSQQLGGVVVGKGVNVTCDSLPGRVFEGRVAVIGADSEFPPTSFPTNIVHMTRAVKVTVALDEGGLPPGTPVDLTILTALP